ncbi:MAG: NAD-dependent protein deacylase [Rhodospirillales bacterium]|nr:NAD-dependent protein deacylase [Rhodospirillales bacterium]
MSSTNIPKDGTIVILTGAGISKESGLDTFRDADGLWSKVNIEDVATPEAFMRNPKMVQEFYNARRKTMASGNIKPNAAHHALARLEKEWGGEVVIVTQNIDDLHEQGGSDKILHMHGEMLKIRCEKCNMVLPWKEDLTVEVPCTECSAQGALRPHVVWFGEMPFYIEEIYQALENCVLFISIGTSGNVYPAAGFVSHVRRYGFGQTVELNLEPSDGASTFHQSIYGAATEIVPTYVEELLTS